MTKKIYVVDLAAEESEEIDSLLSSGATKARKLARAQVLRLSDKGWTDQQVSEAVGVCHLAGYNTPVVRGKGSQAFAAIGSHLFAAKGSQAFAAIGSHRGAS